METTKCPVETNFLFVSLSFIQFTFLWFTTLTPPFPFILTLSFRRSTPLHSFPFTLYHTLGIPSLNLTMVSTDKSTLSSNSFLLVTTILAVVSKGKCWVNGKEEGTRKFNHCILVCCHVIVVLLSRSFGRCLCIEGSPRRLVDSRL